MPGTLFQPTGLRTVGALTHHTHEALHALLQDAWVRYGHRWNNQLLGSLRLFCAGFGTHGFSAETEASLFAHLYMHGGSFLALQHRVLCELPPVLEVSCASSGVVTRKRLLVGRLCLLYTSDAADE